MAYLPAQRAEPEQRFGIDVRGKVPEGESHSSMERLFSMRALRLQLVFTPQEVWSLPKKGGGKIYGVKSRIEAMLVTVGRTGDQLGIWTGR